MQGHVTALDTLSGQGTQGGHVLCQSHGHRDLGQFRGAFYIKQSKGRAGGGVRFGGAADQAKCHRHFQSADKLAVAVKFPARQGRITARTAGKGMGAGFNGPPVIAGGNDNRINAVHDAFVVGGGAIGVDNRQRAGLDNALCHAFARKSVCLQSVGCQAHGGAGQAQIRQIGENAQSHIAACHAFDKRGDGFRHGVDGIGAHGITDIHQQMQYQHRADRGAFKQMDFDILAAAAQFDQHCIARIGRSDNLLLMGQQPCTRAMNIGQVEHLYLGAHDGQSARRNKAATIAGNARHI